MARRWLVGAGVALAISFPVVVVAEILTALRDDGDQLGPVVRAVLVALVLLGPVVGGASVARARFDPVPPAAGATALLIVGAFGLVLQAADDGDGNPLVIPVLAVIGAALGLLGGALGRARAGRTRR